MATMRKMLVSVALGMACRYMLSGVNFITMNGITGRPTAPRSETYTTAKQSTYESSQKNSVTEDAQVTMPWISSVLAVGVALGLVVGFMQEPASANFFGAGGPLGPSGLKFIKDPIGEEGTPVDGYISFLVFGAPAVLVGLPAVGVLAINAGVFPIGPGGGSTKEDKRKEIRALKQ
jgi:hypothetical protein